MSYRRLQRWELRVVEYEGSIVLAEYSKGFYKCPLCDRLMLFHSEKDYIRHLLAHALGTLDRRREPPSRWK